MTATRPDTARNAALIVPLVLANLTAAAGQVLWAQDHLTQGMTVWLGWTVAGMFALAIESIGVFLAFEAHEARMADQSAAFLAAGSYAIGFLAGGLNYSHWTETSMAAALGFGGLSLISPWLWSIRSRSMSRAQLVKNGLIEPRAVRLGRARVIMHPINSWKVYSLATWVGTNDPAAAIALIEPSASPPKESGPPIAGSAEGAAPAPHRPSADPAPRSTHARSTPTARSTRTDDDLRIELAGLIELGPGRGGLTADPSANAIRKALKIAPSKARDLRDERSATQNNDPVTDDEKEPEAVS